MGKITLRQAAAWCGGTVEEKYAEVEFFGANNDTRVLQPGQLFIVLQGARDGHDFIPMALEKGAAAVLCSRKVGDYPAIYVEDPRIALGRIAHEELKRIGAKVVGVTGSVGKSTTKEMIATVLEMGMNHFGEIEYLSKIAEPDVAVIINIGTMHIEFLGSREGIRKAKMEIVSGMAPEGKLLLNGDDKLLRNLTEVPAQEITYFGCSEGCAVRGMDAEQGEVLRFRVKGENADFQAEMALEGEHFVNDALAAVAVGLALGVPQEKIRAQLTSFRNMAGRQEIFEAKGVTIIKDCYNAGPESMAAALKVLGNKKGRRIAVLGDMLELGSCTQAEHYKVGRIAAEKADLVLAYGPNADRIVSGTITGGMNENCTWAFTEKEALVGTLLRVVKPGDVLLFKASRGMHLEQILDAFVKA